MVLFIPLLTALPTTIGISQAISSQNRTNPSASPSASGSGDEKKQMRKFKMECFCNGGKGGRKAREIHGGEVVVRGGKLWIQPPQATTEHPPSSSSQQPPHHHPFLGFYLPYPYPDPAAQPPTLGLVTFISASPPTLNWVYVDKDSREVKYGNRTQSIRHVVGEWGWDLGDDEDEEVEEEEKEAGGVGGGGGGLTLKGEEGAVVRFRQGEGWEVLWEGDGDGEGRIEGGLKVSLERKWVDDGENGDVVRGEGNTEEKMGGKGEEKEEKVGKLEVRTMNATSTRKKGRGVEKNRG